MTEMERHIEYDLILAANNTTGALQKSRKWWTTLRLDLLIPEAVGLGETAPFLR
jgi:hypothetical protein